MGNKGSKRGNDIGEHIKGMSEHMGPIVVSGRYHRLPKRIEDDYKTHDVVLGSGYNGVVQLATSVADENYRFAVKAFKIGNLKREKKAQLESEVGIYLCMDHPHVTRLFDVYEADDQLYLVMECMEGGELFDRVTHVKRFTEMDAADAIEQMLLALNYIHSHGIVHRDLKLENFLYESKESNHLKLIDFGFSKMWDPNIKMHVSCGTLVYVAPEVLKKAYTSQCDIWSLGVIAFVLLSGHMPFSGSEAVQTRNISTGHYVLKPERWSSVSLEGRQFVKAMLEVDPYKRLTAAQSLQHPWILHRRENDDLNVDKGVVEALRQFGKVSKFRRCCLEMMAWSLSNADRAQVRKHFIALDRSQQGTIKLGDLKQVLTQQFDISNEETLQIFDALDSNHDEEIHYSDFLAAMVNTRISIHDHLLQATFKKFDVDSSGYITAPNLRDVLGETFEGEQVEKLLEEADLLKDNRISFEEFKSFLRGDPLESRQDHQELATQVIDLHLRNGSKHSEDGSQSMISQLKGKHAIHAIEPGFTKDAAKALQVAEEAADIYKEIGEKGGETSMLQIVSQLHLELSRPDKAFQVAQEVASMDISLHETAVAQETVYEAFLQQGDQEEAMKVAQELVNLCNDRSDGKREAIARLMVANVHYNLKDFTQCILVAREAQVLLHDLGAFVDEAAAVRMVAEAYLANGELPHAVKAAERSLRLLKNKKKDSEEVQSMLVVASVKLQVLVQDKIRAQRGSPSFNVALEDALEAAETAVHFAREKRMKSQLGQALLTQGQAQLAGLRIDDALKSAAEATEVADELGSEREKANVMCLEADIHFTNGNANKALVLVNKALAIFQEYRDSRGEWIAMNILEQITGPPEEPAQQSEWTEEQWAQWNAWQQQQGASGGGGGGGGVPQGIQKATEEQRVRRRTDAGAKLDVAHISTDTVRKRVEEIVRFTADLDDEPIELDQPLMQVGVTSRTAVGLRNMLSEELPGVDLPFTLIFDYPSVASISDHVMDSLGAVG